MGIKTAPMGNKFGPFALCLCGTADSTHRHHSIRTVQDIDCAQLVCINDLFVSSDRSSYSDGGLL